MENRSRRLSAVLITGAGRGFGRELLSVFAVAGWQTFPLVRSAAVAAELAAEYGSQCYPVLSDVTSSSVEQEIADSLASRTEHLDLLINNAGNIKKKRGLKEATPESLLEHFEVHCVGAMRCVKAALPFLLKSQSPLIINVTSRRGSISWSSSTSAALVYPYHIAKCAQNMLTACLYNELRPQNVAVCAVHPGQLKTAVAPPDAEVEPHAAALRLYEWLRRGSWPERCVCYDLMNDSIIEW